MVGAIVISPTDAASQGVAVGSAKGAILARARAPRDAVVQYCLEYLGSSHPNFELEGSARSVVHEGVLPEAAPCVAYAPVDLDGQVGIVVDITPRYTDLFVSLLTWPTASTLNMTVDSDIPFCVNT